MKIIPILCMILLLIHLSFSLSTKRSLSGNAVTTNGLALNGINLNGILNGIFPNGIEVNGAGTFNAPGTFNGVNPNGLRLNGLFLDGLNFTYMNTTHILVNNIFQSNFTNIVTFFKYLISCTLREGDYWSFTVESVEFKYLGIFGLAPDFKKKNLTLSEERWVSACLFAHVNAFGRSIEISVRSTNVIAASEEEKNDFRVYEGAFFGSIEGGKAFTCQGDDTQKALSESQNRKWRVCTEKDNECLMTALGTCEKVCEAYTKNYGWRECMGNGTKFSEVINVFLESDLKTSLAPQLIQSLSILLFLSLIAFF